MKKFFMFIVVVMACVFTSCNKEDFSFDESTITFEVDVFQKGTPITRSIENSQVIETIKLAMPKYYTLKLTNVENNNVYYFDTQNEYKIPNGKYNVVVYHLDSKNNRIRWDALKQRYNNNIGHRCDDSFLYMMSTGGVILCNSPKINISETIEIKNSGKITLKGTIESSAIVWDSNIVKRVEIHDGTGNNSIFDMKCFVQKDNICVTFHDNTTWDAEIVVYPYENTDYDKKKYIIPKTLELNNYYIIKPYEITNSNTNFDISISDFVCGGDL